MHAVAPNESLAFPRCKAMKGIWTRENLQGSFDVSYPTMFFRISIFDKSVLIFFPSNKFVVRFLFVQIVLQMIFLGSSSTL